MKTVALVSVALAALAINLTANESPPPFTSFEDLLGELREEQLPAKETRGEPRKWGPDGARKVEAEVRRLVGKRISITMAVADDVLVGIVDGKAHYRVQLEVPGKELISAHGIHWGIKMPLYVTLPEKSPLLDTLKQGDLVTVTGKIGGARSSQVSGVAPPERSRPETKEEHEAERETVRKYERAAGLHLDLQEVRFQAVEKEPPLPDR